MAPKYTARKSPPLVVKRIETCEMCYIRTRYYYYYPYLKHFFNQFMPGSEFARDNVFFTWATCEVTRITCGMSRV